MLSMVPGISSSVFTKSRISRKLFGSSSSGNVLGPIDKDLHLFSGDYCRCVCAGHQPVVRIGRERFSFVIGIEKI